jgi:hypothetical protein
MRVIIESILNGMILFWGLAIGPFCWILRDGLGPDATDSQGVDSILRFLMTFYWGPVLLSLVAARLIAGLVGARMQRV